MSVKNIYIHIPFCNNLCSYCDFFKLKSHQDKHSYITNSIIQELSLYKKIINNKIESIYIGGGTPLSVGINNIEKILLYFIKNFNLQNTEITIEINPTGNNNIISFLKSSIINRVSIGIQSFNKKLLKTIGRNIIPDTEFLKKLSKINKILNYDFIFYIPKQTNKLIIRDIQKIIVYNPKHLSFYSLTLKNNLFGKYIENTYLSENHDKMFKLINEELYKNRFIQYEISSYSQNDKYKSIHNCNYWSGNNYIGAGPGAWGTINNERYCNYKNLSKYVSNIKQYKKPIVFKEKLTYKKQYNEYIFLNFRKNQGININAFEQKFRKNFLEKYENLLKEYIKYFIIDNKFIRLNINGMLNFNSIISKFLI